MGESESPGCVTKGRIAPLFSRQPPFFVRHICVFAFPLGRLRLENHYRGHLKLTSGSTHSGTHMHPTCTHLYMDEQEHIHINNEGLKPSETSLALTSELFQCNGIYNSLYLSMRAQPPTSVLDPNKPLPQQGEETENPLVKGHDHDVARERAARRSRRICICLHPGTSCEEEVYLFLWMPS